MGRDSPRSGCTGISLNKTQNSKEKKQTSHLTPRCAIVAFCLLVFALPSSAATYTVINCNDSGAGSLRQAITDANAHAGGDTIEFNVPNTDGGYTTESSVSFWRISPTSDLPQLTNGGTTIDAATQTANRGNTNANGPEVELRGRGLYINNVSNCAIKGLAINSVTGSGVTISGSSAASNEVKWNYIGTDANGTADLGNTLYGVYITGGKYNLIGGATAGERNIISGNNSSGVYLYGTNTDSNEVKGNYIGTDANGTADLGNTLPGVYIIGGKYNLIGGAAAGERNIISGNNNFGVCIANTNTDSNEVKGNYIGTDVNGTADLGNTTNGIYIAAGALFNVIGGATAGERNIISGNDSSGIYISNTNSNEVTGNYIGTDVNGTADLGNTLYGVYIYSAAKYNLIGGATAGERNIISGNDSSGIFISGTNTDSNEVAGNYIVTHVKGTADLGNTLYGVYIYSAAKYNLIGGATAGERNIISGNNSSGIFISGANTHSNEVAGNYIGTDVNGTADLGNTAYGVLITGGEYKLIGGATPGERNIISGNNSSGIFIYGTNTDSNEVTGNYIGTDANGTADLGNTLYGVYIYLGSRSNFVGPNNIIAGNDSDGVRVDWSGTLYNRVTRNSSYGNSGKGIKLINGGNSSLIYPSVTSAQYNSLTGQTVIQGA